MRNRCRCAVEQTGDGDDVGAGFEVDEAGDVVGVVAAAGPDGDVSILALRAEGGVGEGHPVFPAVEAADVEGAEGVGAEAVGGGPDAALVIDWRVGVGMSLRWTEEISRCSLL